MENVPFRPFQQKSSVAVVVVTVVNNGMLSFPMTEGGGIVALVTDAIMPDRFTEGTPGLQTALE